MSVVRHVTPWRTDCGRISMYTFAPRPYQSCVCRIAHEPTEPSLFSHNGPERGDPLSQQPCLLSTTSGYLSGSRHISLKAEAHRR